MFRRSAFTLIEVLMATGVIIILAGILIPAIGAARNASSQTVCLCHIRQLGAATLSYVSDNSQVLPGPNFLSKDAAGTTGWLYTAPIQFPPAEAQLETGSLYCYLHSHTFYHCPQDEHDVVPGPAQVMSSFTMNGAAIAYGSVARTSPYRLEQMAPTTVAIWEAGAGSSSAFMAGGSTPDVGPTLRHGRNAAVSFWDGHAERWSAESFAYEQNVQPGALWCNPRNISGM